MSHLYNELDVKAIQESYCYLFPVINKKLEWFWYPPDKFDWLCLTSPFHSRPTFDKFQALDADLQSLKLTAPVQEYKAIGQGLSRLAKKHGVGYSVGLNPWADYMLLLASQTDALQEVVVVVAHNWNPLVKKGKILPNSPLYKDNPCESDDGKYAFVFEPFLSINHTACVLFTNIFPHFIEAGKGARDGPSLVQRNFIGQKNGMKKGLIWTLGAINPSIRIRGLITLGAPAFALLSDRSLTDTVESIRAKLRRFPSLTTDAYETFLVKGTAIPWLPFFHPDSYEVTNAPESSERRDDYYKLASALR